MPSDQIRFMLQDYTQDDDAIGPEVPDRVFAHAVLAGLQYVIQEQVTSGWDLDAHLAMLFQRSRSPAGQPGLQRVYLEWQPIPMPPSDRPSRMIVALADRCRTIPTPVPANLMAVALVAEGWATSHENTPEARQRLDQVAAARQIHQEPDRIEVKLVNAVDLNGVRYGLIKPRTTSPSAPAWCFKPKVGLSGSSAAAGDLPNSLHYLMEIMQGKDLPDYRTWWTAHHDYTKY